MAISDDDATHVVVQIASKLARGNVQNVELERNWKSNQSVYISSAKQKIGEEIQNA